MQTQEETIAYEKKFWTTQKEQVDVKNLLAYYKNYRVYLEESIQRNGFASDYRRTILDATIKTIDLLESL